jgi:hypothetical protein
LLFECASGPASGQGWIQTGGGSRFRCLIVDASGATPWDFR